MRYGRFSGSAINSAPQAGVQIDRSGRCGTVDFAGLEVCPSDEQIGTGSPVKGIKSSHRIIEGNHLVTRRIWDCESKSLCLDVIVDHEHDCHAAPCPFDLDQHTPLLFGEETGLAYENFPKGTGLNGAETHFLLSEASRLRRMSHESGDDPASLALRELADEYEAEVRSRQQPAPTLPEPYSGGPAGSGAG